MATSSGKPDKLLGELLPQGGGDPIPLLKERLTVGRRENCDIVLRFGNVSSNHCELTLEHGYWFVKDLGSRNGTRLNGYRISKKRMDPGDTLSIAKRDYKAKYSPAELGAEGPPPDVDVMVEIMSQSLLEGAGLARASRQKAEGRVGLKKPRPAAGDPADPLDNPAGAAVPEKPAANAKVSTTDPPDNAVSSPSAAAAGQSPKQTSDPEQTSDTADRDEGPDEYTLAPET